jgi:hypothetical protein
MHAAERPGNKCEQRDQQNLDATIELQFKIRTGIE